MRCRLLILAPLLAWGCATVQPPHPRALENNELCAMAMGAGDLDRADTYCDLGLQFSPNYGDLLTNKGLIHLKRGQTDKARDLFIQAIRRNADQAQAYNNLGYIYLMERSYGRAHDSLQSALRINPDYIQARYNLALTYKNMGRKADARKEYRTVLAVNPDIANVYNDLGLIALEEGALEEAVESFTKATSLDPSYVESWLHLGIAHTEAGKYAEARDAFTSCLEVDPNNVQCRNNVVLVNRKAVLLDPTLKEVEEARATAQSAPELYTLGQQYRTRGLRNEEERTYKRCVRVEGRFAPCHYALFLVYREDRRDNEATIACKNFLKFAMAEEFPAEVEACERFVSRDAY